MGLKIVIPTEYQRVNKISLRAMGLGGLQTKNPHLDAGFFEIL